MLVLVNQVRQANGIPPLQFSKELEEAAQAKSEEMAGGHPMVPAGTSY
jgi:uncharacterized protein YkwD